MYEFQASVSKRGPSPGVRALQPVQCAAHGAILGMLAAFCLLYLEIVNASFYTPDSEFLTLGDAAYERLRQAIFQGVVPEGARLTDALIAPALGMSRTPVRQALQRLLGEGVLHYSHSRSLVVAVHDESARQEHAQALATMEAWAAAEAAAHATLVELAQMQEVLQLEALALACGDLATCALTNWQFHGIVWQATHNRFLVKMMALLRDAAQVLWRNTGYDADSAAVAHQQHLALLQALQARDAQRARALAQDHQDSDRAARQAQRAQAAQRNVGAGSQKDWLQRLQAFQP